MLLYYLFWMIMGFIIHFYIIFGTNLLTGGPAQNCCFFAYSKVSQKKNIKRSPNGMKPSGKLFLERKQSRGLGVHVRESTRKARGRGARPGEAPPTLVTASLIPCIGSKSPWSCSVRKSRSRRFCSVWTPFDIPFLQNPKTGKKTTILGWASD